MRQTKLFGTGKTVVNYVAVASGVGFALLGYDQGVMAGLIGSPDTPFSRTFKNPDATTLGIMVAIYEIGCFFGAMFILFYGERFGRRVCMIGGGSVMLVGAVLQCTSYSMAQLIVGRIITGLGNGANFSSIPVWAAEISGQEVRGQVAAFDGWLIIWGVVISYWVDYGCANYDNGMQWRFPIALQLAFAVIMMAMVVYLPESPRWLISQNRDAEAKEVIRWITVSKNSEDIEETALATYNEIIHTRNVEVAAEGEFQLKELFEGGEMQNWRRMAISFGIMACQQLSGINLLTYYIAYVLENSVGLSHNMSLLIGGFNGLEYLVASAIPIFTIEKVGRRKLLIFGAIGQSISMAVLAAAIWYVSVMDGPHSYAMGIVAVACFFAFNTFYGQGWLAIPFFYPAEITNLRTRSRGVAISVMSNWIFTFLVVMITPICTANIGWKTYIIFAVLNASFVPIVYFFFPETSGLSLEALDHLFESGGITRNVLNKAHRRKMLEISRGGTQVESSTHTQKEDSEFNEHIEGKIEV